MPELTPDRLAMGLTYYVVLLFSLSVHESAHGWMALRMGDDTAAREGRITLDPLSHIDPVGTVLVPLLQILWIGLPLLGWAKPTPVGAQNFRRLARGHVLVASAGPVSNVVLAVLFTGLLYAARHSSLVESDAALALLNTGVYMNVVLALFNLIMLAPIELPLVAFALAPRRTQDALDRADAYVRTHESRVLWVGALLAAGYLIVSGVAGLLR